MHLRINCSVLHPAGVPSTVTLINIDYDDICWFSITFSFRFDILPLILQFGEKNPQYFELPEEVTLQVPITHPK